MTIKTAVKFFDKKHLFVCRANFNANFLEGISHETPPFPTAIRRENGYDFCELNVFLRQTLTRKIISHFHSSYAFGHSMAAIVSRDILSRKFALKFAPKINVF